MRPVSVFRALSPMLVAAMHLWAAPSAALAQPRAIEDAPEGAAADEDSPGADVPDRDLPDVELPDGDLPDADLPDRDLPDRDLPSGEDR
jgi:hypothetical protein